MIDGLEKAAIKTIKRFKCITVAVIVAAGSSQRMNGVDKLFAPLGSEPLLAATLDVFQKCKLISSIVLVLNTENLDRGKEMCSIRGYDKVSQILTGGKTRAESSAIGIKAVGRSTDIILIHDGDRPFVTEALIKESIFAARKWQAAAAAIPASATIKKVVGNFVEETYDRSKLFEMQTPQAFNCSILKGAIKIAEKNGFTATDDCSMVEAIGVKPVIIPGNRDNIKVTYPEDLLIANALIKIREGQS